MRMNLNLFNHPSSLRADRVSTANAPVINARAKAALTSTLMRMKKTTKMMRTQARKLRVQVSKRKRTLVTSSPYSQTNRPRISYLMISYLT